MRQKKWLLCLLALVLLSRSYAQNTAINEDNSAADPNALLDIRSATRGVLFPRMGTVDRLAIPATRGLLVFDTTTRSFWFNNGTAWTSLGALTGIGSWSLRGNSVDSGEVVGTLDQQPLLLKVNGVLSGRLDPLNGNAFFGYNTAFSTRASSFNTAFGSGSLHFNDVGSNNTGVGISALGNNTSGSNNTGFGGISLRSNSTGAFNTAAGYNSIGSNATGLMNTAIGALALFSNTIFSQHTAIGAQAMSSYKIGSRNTVTGMGATLNDTLNNFNTATGFEALHEGAHPQSNTATGYMALFSCQLGTNTAMGYKSSASTTTGGGNFAFGEGSLQNNTTGSSNTAIGDFALSGNVSGAHNIGFGEEALEGNTTGSSNTAVGSWADVGSGNLTNVTAIGANAVVNQSNKIRIGDAAITVIEGAVNFSVPSDGRFKFNIKEDVQGLDFIQQLRPVTYQFDGKRMSEMGGHVAKDAAAYDEANRIRRSGFIAQEVEQAALKANFDFSGLVKPATSDGYYSLNYESFVVPLVRSVQEVSAKIDSLEKENELLKKRLIELDHATTIKNN